MIVALGMGDGVCLRVLSGKQSLRLAMLPTGASEDREVFAATARKEYQWSKLSDERRKLWAAAAEKGCKAYTDNSAIDVLDAKQSAAVRRNLAQRGELDRILTPRFVLTDKSDGARTASNPLPIEASARLVVPGYQDRANLEGEIRKDSPAGTGLSQHLLLSLIAWRKEWAMMSADVKSTFLKGGPFVARELYLGRTNGKNTPSIPIPDGCIARVRKGVFGLADAPREWWLRLSRSLETRGWQRNPLGQASWLLWDDPVKRTKLRGVIVSHVDDLLFGGDQTAQASLTSIGDELGFREVSRDSFVCCGKQFTRRPDGSVSLSMGAYRRNLRPIVVPKNRKADLLSP